MLERATLRGGRGEADVQGEAGALGDLRPRRVRLSWVPTVSGTPPEGSACAFAGIQIMVSDGKNSTAMDAFATNVVMPAVGSAELAWEPLTLNEDGAPLTDRSGYVTRYGMSAAALYQSVKISNPGTTMYVVDNLIEGTWYFSLSSVNSAGVESRPTGYVSTTIG